MATWRPARAEDDDAIVAMSQDLYGPAPPHGVVSEAQIRATLATFRVQPIRGRALVLDEAGTAAGYAFLASYWSNELGGEVCTIDELYVVPGQRSRGHGTAMMRSVMRGEPLWPGRPVALELEVSPSNHRALALYARLGFVPRLNATLRLVL
jgi:ribosomal protein S18 acetylase RimI-like enzyme